MTQKALKYGRIEAERRFFLSQLPADLPATYTAITDYYITDTRLRLRRMETAAGELIELKLGQKYTTDDPTQTVMTNIYLNEMEYKILSGLPARLLHKQRYAYAHGRYTYSLDVFTGALAGLILAEIEAQPGITIELLPVPSFAVCEVTAVPLFTGGLLFQLTPAEFQQHLATFLQQM
jgi:CYTH domain-containing protein